MLKLIKRIFLVIGIFLGFILILILGTSCIIINGPSKKARDLFVISAMETSVAKIIPQIYLSKSRIEDIMSANTIVASDEITDSDEGFNIIDEELKEKIDIVDVSGPTFKGKMMIVYDPSRVSVVSIPSYSYEKGKGWKVAALAESVNAVAAINGGAFYDNGSAGMGGMPIGVVITNGVLRKGDSDEKFDVMGFDNNNKLIVGSMSGREAIKRNIRDGLSFGPIFITNGEPAKSVGTGSGLNPRTAIGQRADGAVLLLVIDGRQPHSLGASYKDCIDVMMEFEAINAANLDGGSSSTLYYKGEFLNISSSLYGPRSMPTAFVVK